MAATIHDVAAMAKVSIKTVSRVMNNEPYVREPLRQRVQAAAQALNYRPKQSARSLAGARSFLIALLYDNPSVGYVAALQSGLARRCRESNYHLVVEPVDAHSPDIYERTFALISALALDGIVLTPPLSDDLRLIAVIKAAGVQLVRVAPQTALDEGLRVYMDEREAGRAMTDYLLSIGHRRIGMVRGHPEHRAAAARFDGYCDALGAAGIAIDSQLTTQGYFDVRSGIEAGALLLAGARRPSAIFAANDDMALGVMMAARNAGLSIPDELSLAGFDDTPMSRAIWPPLTTVRQPIEAMGEAAAALIIDRSPREDPIKLDFELIVRASTNAI